KGTRSVGSMVSHWIVGIRSLTLLEKASLKTQRSMNRGWERIALGASVAIILMAFVVLVGWHAHIRVAVQIFHGLIPMQYNTALCFLALGTAGVSLITGRRLLLLI